MKKIKYIIFSLIIIILILIIVLLNINNSSKESDDSYSMYEGQNEVAELKKTIQFSEYYIIKECIQKYIDFSYKNNSIYYEKQEDGNEKYIEDTQKQVIYSLLNENYINENGLTKSNLLQKIQLFSKKQQFYPVNIEILEDSDIMVYKVYGAIQDLEYIEKKEVYYILFVNKNKQVFNIIPIDSNLYTSYTLNKNIPEIQNKEYNTYNLSNLQNEQIATEYFEAYRFLTLANPKFTYEKMSEEYRNKRFGSLDNYVLYIKNNYNEFKNIIPKKYLSDYNGKYNQYVVQDQNQNYYIFDTTDALNYFVRLDTYTIEEEKFKTTYESANNEKRVQMNIDKFFQMINRQDYRTSYSVLDESFKAKNIKIQDDFERIVKNRLFKYNTINFVNYNDLGSNTYAYNIKLTDLTKQKDGEVNMTIIMQLKEGTDFVMSFSFK